MSIDRNFYEQYAKNYPDDLVIRASQLAKIKQVLVYKNKIGLDIGSANGALAIELAKTGAKKMYGIDLAQGFINKAGKKAKEDKLKNVEFIQADARKLPFEDNFFDFATCVEVLEHVPNFEKAIGEVKRVLKPGGTFVITVPNSLNPVEILHQLKHLLFYIFKKEPITHINLFFMPTFSRYFKWARKINISFLHFILPFLPKKYVSRLIINFDLFLGEILRPFAYNIIIKGEK